MVVWEEATRETKYCKGCKKFLLLEEFGCNKHMMCGFMSKCKKCYNAYKREYAHKNLEKIRTIKQQSRERNKEKINTRRREAYRKKKESGV